MYGSHKSKKPKKGAKVMGKKKMVPKKAPDKKKVLTKVSSALRLKELRLRASLLQNKRIGSSTKRC